MRNMKMYAQTNPDTSPGVAGLAFPAFAQRADALVGRRVNLITQTGSV